MSESSESSSSEQNSETKKETIYHDFLVHLTIITEIMKRGEDGEIKCICKNNIAISNENKSNVFIEREIVPKVRVPLVKNEQEENEKQKSQQNSEYEALSQNLKKQPLQIKLADLCSSLRLLGYPVTGSMINLYMKEAEDFVFFGADPIDTNVYVDSDQVDFNCLRVKIINFFDEKILKKLKENKKEGSSVRNGGTIDENDGEGDNDDDFEDDPNIDVNNSNAQKDPIKKKEKRTKERKIGFIIEKVNAWRKLYNGFYNENGEHTRYSLDQAAKIIKISKKSLDDYLLQLRLGRKYGFDFNKNKNSRVGVLRVFVKNHRSSEVKEKKV